MYKNIIKISALLIFSLLTLGCSKYITHQELSHTLEVANETSNQYARNQAQENSLAVYECLGIQSYVNQTNRVCMSTSPQNPLCGMLEIWRSYCLRTNTEDGVEVLVNPRPGVASAIRRARRALRHSGRRNQSNQSCDTADQAEIDNFTRNIEPSFGNLN